jgi:ABC-type transport system substrate-binding protein
MYLFVLILVTGLGFAETLCLNHIRPKYHHATHLDYVNPNAPQSNQLIIADNSQQPYTTQPFGFGGKTAPGLLSLVYEPLIKAPADDTACYYPYLVTPSIKNNQIILKLHQATFSNGEVLTAKDVIHSIRQTKKSPQLRHLISPLKKAYIKQNEIRIIFSGSKDQAIIALSRIPISNQQNLGTGPYTISALDKDQIVYHKNNAYWGKKHWLNLGRFNYKSIIYRFIHHASANKAALKNQYIDLYEERSGKRWLEVKKTDPNSVESLKQTTHQYTQFLVFNHGFSDQHLRKIIAHAVDFEIINRVLCGNQYQIPQSNLTPPTHLNKTATSIRLIIQPNWYPTAVLIAKMLKPYGITVNILSLPYSAYVHAIRMNQFDLTISSILKQPGLQHSDIYPKYFPKAYHHDLEATQLLDQLMQDDFLIPMWSAPEFRIHHRHIALKHLEGVDQLDLFASWKQESLPITPRHTATLRPGR